MPPSSGFPPPRALSASCRPGGPSAVPAALPALSAPRPPSAPRIGSALPRRAPPAESTMREIEAGMPRPFPLARRIVVPPLDLRGLSASLAGTSATPLPPAADAAAPAPVGVGVGGPPMLSSLPDALIHPRCAIFWGREGGTRNDTEERFFDLGSKMRCMAEALIIASSRPLGDVLI